MTAEQRPALVLATSSAPMRRLLAQRLSTCGVEIIEAVDVDDAIGALSRRTPTSVIISSDLGPGQAGLRLARALAAYAAKLRLPIVLLLEQGEPLPDLLTSGQIIYPLCVNRFRSLSVLARTVMNLHSRALQTVASLTDEELAPRSSQEDEASLDDLKAQMSNLEDALDLFSSVIKRVRDGRLPGPMMPELLGQVQELLSSDQVTLRDISGFVDKHQALAAKLVSMANSAIYARGATVREVEKAVMRLGLNECGALMRALAALGFLAGKDPELRQLIRDNLRHGYVVALVADTLGRLAKYSKVSTLYTIGLFHNIGSTFFIYTVALLRDKGEIGPVQPRALATMAKSKADFLNRLLCKHLRLPVDIEKIYGFSDEESSDAGLRLIHRAMWVAEQLLVGDRQFLEMGAEAELLGLSFEDVAAINERLPSLRESLHAYTSAESD